MKLSAEDARYLQDYDPTSFERPSVTVDVALLSVVESSLCTLLVRRDAPPHRSRWALPGGFVAMDEALESAAARVLRDKVGLGSVYLEQLYTFGAPKRDPRTRVISVAYCALVDRARFSELCAATRRISVASVRVPWAGETGGPIEAISPTGAALRLAFDHDDILGMAVKRIRGKLSYTPVGFQLLPERFTLRDLQHVHEVVLGQKLNKDSFRRRMLASEQLEATGDRQADVGHRPAELYRLSKRSAI